MSRDDDLKRWRGEQFKKQVSFDRALKKLCREFDVDVAQRKYGFSPRPDVNPRFTDPPFEFQTAWMTLHGEIFKATPQDLAVEISALMMRVEPTILLQPDLINLPQKEQAHLYKSVFCVALSARQLEIPNCPDVPAGDDLNAGTAWKYLDALFKAVHAEALRREGRSVVAPAVEAGAQADPVAIAVTMKWQKPELSQNKIAAAVGISSAKLGRSKLWKDACYRLTQSSKGNIRPGTKSPDGTVETEE